MSGSKDEGTFNPQDGSKFMAEYEKKFKNVAQMSAGQVFYHKESCIQAQKWRLGKARPEPVLRLRSIFWAWPKVSKAI